MDIVLRSLVVSTRAHWLARGTFQSRGSECPARMTCRHSEQSTIPSIIINRSINHSRRRRRLRTWEITPSSSRFVPVCRVADSSPRPPVSPPCSTPISWNCGPARPTAQQHNRHLHTLIRSSPIALDARSLLRHLHRPSLPWQTLIINNARRTRCNPSVHPPLTCPHRIALVSDGCPKRLASTWALSQACCLSVAAMFSPRGHPEPDYNTVN